MVLAQKPAVEKFGDGAAKDEAVPAAEAVVELPDAGGSTGFKDAGFVSFSSEAGSEEKSDSSNKSSRLWAKRDPEKQRNSPKIKNFFITPARI